MPLTALDIADLHDVHLSRGQLEAVAKIIDRHDGVREEGDQRRRQLHREAQARYREKKGSDVTVISPPNSTDATPAPEGDVTVTSAVTSRDVTSDHGDITEPPPKEIPHTPLETTPSEEPPTSSLRSDAPPTSSTSHGTRLPDDWQPDEGDALVVGLSLSQAFAEADKFRDYWRATPGQKGRKADWRATWRNWCRNAAERNHGNGKGHLAAGRKPAAHDALLGEVARQFSAGSRKSGRAPGDPGLFPDAAEAGGGEGSDHQPTVDLPADAYRKR